MGCVAWRASSIAKRLLSDWAVGAIAQGSAGVYRLEPGGVRLNWWLRRLRVDSIYLTTNPGVNARRQLPLPEVRVALYNCTISGVHLTALALGEGLLATSLGCRAGGVAVEVPRRASDNPASEPSPVPTMSSGGAGGAFLVLKQGLRLPPYAPRVRITGIAFPNLAFDFRLPRGRTGETEIQLERLEWLMTGLEIDPADTGAAARPLFSRTIELVASNFEAHPDKAVVVRVGQLRASLTDSTLEVRGVDFCPTGSDRAFARSQRYRHDLIKITVGRAKAQGLDFGAFAVGRGTSARRLEVDSFRADISSDKRRPDNPSHQPHRTPQQWIADLDETLSVDSVVVQDGEIVYREHSVGRMRPGVITFAHIQATATRVRHIVGRRGSADAMALTASANLQHVGELKVQFEVPLDASQFDMDLQGTLGAMPATALNAFVEEVAPLKIASGEVTEVGFRVKVTAGVARGTITPRFNDLSIAVTARGSGGIMGGGGIVGGVARSLASFAANRWKVRSNNPENAKAPVLRGKIRHVFRSRRDAPRILVGERTRRALAGRQQVAERRRWVISRVTT